MNHLKLKRGQLCKVVTDEHIIVEKGEIIEYLNYNWMDGYVFKLSDGKRVCFKDDTDFETLQSEADIKFLIDLALDTKDEDWFYELAFKIISERSLLLLNEVKVRR